MKKIFLVACLLVGAVFAENNANSGNSVQISPKKEKIAFVKGSNGDCISSCDAQEEDCKNRCLTALDRPRDCPALCDVLYEDCLANCRK